MNAQTSGTMKISVDSRRRRNTNIPKTISYFFLISQLISGFHLGFTKMLSKNVHGRLRIFTIVIACTYNVIIFAPAILFSASYFDLTFFIILLEYTVNAIILCCYKKYTIYDFLCNISEFSNLSKNEIYLLNFISVIHSTIIYSLKCMLTVPFTVRYIIIEQYCHFFYVFFCCSWYFFVDLVRILQIVIFYYVYATMKHLNFMLTSSGQKVDFISKRYKNIVGVFEKVKPLLHSLVSLT